MSHQYTNRRSTRYRPGVRKILKEIEARAAREAISRHKAEKAKLTEKLSETAFRQKVAALKTLIAKDAKFREPLTNTAGFETPEFFAALNTRAIVRKRVYTLIHELQESAPEFDWTAIQRAFLIIDREQRK